MYLAGIFAPPSFMDGWRAFDVLDEELLGRVRDDEVIGLVGNGHDVIRAWASMRGLAQMLEDFNDTDRLVDACLRIHVFWDGLDAGARAVLDAAEQRGRRVTAYYFGPMTPAGPDAGPTVYLSSWDSRGHKAPLSRAQGKVVWGRQWTVMDAPGTDHERGDGPCPAACPSALRPGPHLWPGNLTAVAGQTSVTSRNGPVARPGTVERVADGDTLCTPDARHRAAVAAELAAAGWRVILDGAAVTPTAPGRIGA